MSLSSTIGWIRRQVQWASNSRLLHNRWLRLGIQVLILVLCLVYLGANWRSIRDARLELSLRLVMLAWTISATAVFLGAMGWWLTLRSLGHPASWGDAARVHIYANLAKYVPGYAWQLLGKAYLSRNSGVPVNVVAIAMALELIQLVVAGFWVTAMALPHAVARSWLGGNFWIGWLWILRLVFLLVLAGLPFTATWLARQRRGWAADVRINPWLLSAATLSILVGWWVLGLSYWMLGAALQPLPFAQVGFFTFTLALSFLVGLAVVVVPGSIGIREGIMVMLLEPIVGSPVAVVIAALSRVVLTLSELVSAFGIWLVQHKHQ